MIKEENLTAIETQLGLKPGDFKAMYEDKEVKELPIADYAIVKKSDHEIITKADYTARISNIEKAKYDEGKIAGDEIVKKEFAKTFGIELSGEQSKKANVDFFKTAITTKVLADNKIEPDKKVKELEAEKQTLLQRATDWENKYTGLEGTFKEKENAFKIDAAIKAKLPAGVKTKIPLSDMAELYKMKRNPKFDAEGKVVVHGENGEVLKNAKTLSPITIEEDMAEWQASYLEAPAGGGGGGDNPAQGKPGSLQAFTKEMKDKGVNEGTTAYNHEMRERIKAKTLVI